MRGVIQNRGLRDLCNFHVRNLLFGAVALPLLAGCVTPGSAFKPTGTRNPEVAMASLATLDTLKFSGRWYEVEAFVPDGKSCVIGAVTFTRQTSGDLMVTEGPCADGAPRQGLAKRIGPGRFAFEGDEIWVFWVDAEYHVAVIGSPSGAAHVLSREMSLPPDRQRAVHEILAWNGYDVTRLRPARRK